MYEELVMRLRKRAINIKEKFSRNAELLSELMQAADAIEKLLRKEKFHAFLWNVINPNDMQLYLEMYHSGNEKENAG